jgi:PKD repeat protein
MQERIQLRGNWRYAGEEYGHVFHFSIGSGDPHLFQPQQTHLRGSRIGRRPSMKRLLALVALFFATPALSATYYVDCAASNDKGVGTSPETAWQTIDKVNRSTFKPGDSILFKRGCTWREQLAVPSSGAAGQPITFGAYGSGALPIIDANDVLNAVWTRDVNNANLWWASLASDPNSLIIDGNFGVKKPAASLAAPYHWAYEKSAARLWLWSPNDPASHVFEYGKRPSAAYLNGKAHLLFRDLDLRGGTWKTVDVLNSPGDVALDGLTVKSSGRDAISANYDGGLMDGLTVKNCTLGPASGSGVWLEEAKNILIASNAIFSIGIDDTLDYTNGVQIFGPTCDNITIQDNHIYSGGRIRSEQVATGYHGGGVHLDSVGTDAIVRRNLIHDCAAANSRGIHLEIVSDGLAQDNIVYRIGGEALALTSWGTNSFTNNKVYNNTAYGSRDGIVIHGPFPVHPGSVTKNDIRNNISVGNYGRQFVAKWGGENDGTNGYGNIYEHNCFGVEASNFIEWGHAAYKSTYAVFEAAYGSATHAVTTDPTLTGAVSGDFTLQTGSPCIDAGADLGPSYSTALMPGSSWPNNVLTGDQRNTGQWWEIGAYAFPAGPVGPPPPTPTPTPTPPPPVGLAASFTYSPETPTQGERVEFTDSSSGASAWDWDFGDGTRATYRNPVHTYAARGTFTVVLWVSNGVNYSQAVKTVTMAPLVRKHLPKR